MGKNISILKKIVLNFFIIIAIFLIFISLYIFIQIFLMHKKYFNVFNYTVFEVKTSSMVNTLNVGDIVIDKILDEDQKDSLKVGDIISYNDENYIITHRIREINSKIVTKGDANNADDTPIIKENVIGKVVKIIPKFGIYRKVLLDKKIFILICITVFLFVISFLIKEKPNEELKGFDKKGINNDKNKYKK